MGVVLGPDVPHFLSGLFHDPAHGGVRGFGFAALDGARHVHMQLQRFVVRKMRHQAVFRAAGENLAHQVMQLGEHRIA